MNVEEYISSGILEAYALGDLTVAERKEVEKNLSELSTNKNKKYFFYDKSKERFIVNIRIGSYKTESEANDAAIKAIEKLKN